MKVLLCDFAQVLLLPKRYQDIPAVQLQRQVKQLGSSVLALNKINTELLTFISGLRGIKKCLFTAGTAHTDPAVARKIEDVFQQVFTTPEIGFPKSDPRAFEKVVEILAVESQDCFFVDDMSANVQAAKEAGLNATVYTNNTAVIMDIQRWLK